MARAVCISTRLAPRRSGRTLRLNMGASGWNYFVPYQADVEVALQRLRAEVFERGEYGQGQGIPPDVLANIPPEVKGALQALRDLDSQRLSGPFDTIDELLEGAAESGTHSILDIQRTAEAPDFAVAWPAPSEAINQVYNRVRPSHQQIEAHAGELSQALELEGWQAAYVIVYDHERPTEIYFEGVSGD